MLLALKVHMRAGNPEEDASILARSRRGFREDEVRTDGKVNPGYSNTGRRGQQGVVAAECLRPETVADVIESARVSWTGQNG